MSKYIAVEALQDINKYFFPEIGEIIENAPTIDIVRCKDCKNWRDDGLELGRCNFHEVNFCRADGFCFWGERKEIMYYPQVDGITPSVINADEQMDCPWK